MNHQELSPLPSSTNKKYFVELESIRGLMAWWVVLGHFYSLFSPLIPLPSILRHFLLATAVPVDIFICLSGFVIASTINTKRVDYKSFIRRRFFRIYPIYILFLLVSILSFDFRAEIRTHSEWMAGHDNTAISYFSTIKDNMLVYILTTITLLQGAITDQLLPYSGIAFLPPAWSLSLEWQFYILAPFITLFFTKNRTAIYLLLILIVASAIFFHCINLSFSYGSFILNKLYLFAIGMSSFYLLSGTISLKNFSLIITAGFISALLGNSQTAHIFSVALWTACFLFALNQKTIYLVKIKSMIVWVLQQPILLFLGKISYPTYLCHVLVIDAIAAYISHEPINSISFQKVLLVFFFVFVTTIVISYLSHRFIELPFIAIGKGVNTRSMKP